MAKRNYLLGMSVAVLALVFIGCASAPRPPSETIVYDSNLSEDQMATFFVPPGNFQVTYFNGELADDWFQMTTGSGGIDVKIPAGECIIGFNYYGGEYIGEAKDVMVNFIAIAGRRYKIVAELLGTGTYSSEMSFSVIETATTREPNADEQVLYVKQNNYFGNLVVLDKGTENERIMLLDPGALINEELRVIIPKGEHTLDLALMNSAVDSGATIESTGFQFRQFTAAANPIRYSVDIEIKRGGGTVTTIYTLKQE